MQTDSQPAFQMTRETRKEILYIIDERIEQAQIFRSDIVEMNPLQCPIRLSLPGKKVLSSFRVLNGETI